MNAREKLLTLITYHCSNETAARILGRLDQFARAGYTMVANEWDEAKHPRADDGKFAENGGGATNNRTDRASVPTDRDRVMRERNDETRLKIDFDDAMRVFKKKPTKRSRDRDDATVAEHRRRAKEGRSLEECRREQSRAHDAYRRAKSENAPDVAKRRDEWMESKRETKRAEKNEREFKDASRRIRHYNELAAEIEDEIDEIEEKYGVEQFQPLKWPETQDADHDRERYGQLLKERKRLDKITSAVFAEEEDENDDEED